VEQDVTLVRWGEIGTPVLLFPTAGGDAEEAERFLMLDALAPLLSAGRIKVYSVDSVAGRTILSGEGSAEHASWIQSQFHHFVRQELVPAIRDDCRSPEIEIVSAGSSIGAFNALGVLCRFPEVFSRAICMSGTYDLVRFLPGGRYTEDFYFSSPIHFLPNLADGEILDRLRRRFVLFAFGQGRWEDPTETWRMAHVLGARGIPNRVDPWGAQYDHNWPTWREMLPRYLAEVV
jgi:esterase/lipase superfamily enzyme